MSFLNDRSILACMRVEAEAGRCRAALQRVLEGGQVKRKARPVNPRCLVLTYRNIPLNSVAVLE